MRCAKNRSNGQPCQAQAVTGTDACRVHAGRPLDQHKAKGAVVVELSRWGITDKTLDPGVTLLQLMTQAFYRAKLYGELLEQAYEAAERLRASDDVVHAMDEPPSVDSAVDRDRAAQDLQRIFATGGVSALIGHTYAADKDGGVFATGEAIRGLVQLEAQERDRAAGMAAKAVAAGLATRQVELAERQGALVVEVLRGSLTELARMMAAGEITTVDPSDPAVTRVVATRLRALSAAEGAA
jgi:hypothetical protein